MNVILHSDKCIACGTCVAMAPDLFSVDSGVVTLKKDPKTYSEEDKKKAREAAKLCPNDVIEVAE